MRIYVYRTGDLYLEISIRWLSALFGMCYVAYSEKYPRGKCLAYGFTVRGTIRKAKRELRKRDRSNDWKNALPIVVDV